MAKEQNRPQKIHFYLEDPMKLIYVFKNSAKKLSEEAKEPNRQKGYISFFKIL